MLRTTGRAERKPELWRVGGHLGKAPSTRCEGDSAVRAAGIVQVPMGLPSTRTARRCFPASSAAQAGPPQPPAVLAGEGSALLSSPSGGPSSLHGQ